METLIYYLGLYSLVFLLKFIYLARRANRNVEAVMDGVKSKIDWWRIFDVSLDLVYTSAGFAIALVENLPNWIPAIMILYIFLVILSASVDTLNGLNRNARTTIHAIIAVCVIAITIAGYKTNFGKPRVDSGPTSKFKVVIPYTDLSLIKYAGLDFGSAPENNYRVVIVASDEHEAKEAAIDTLFSCNTNYPLYGDKTTEAKRNQLRINADEIVIMKLNH
jgi:hypothetical protein